MREPGTGKNCFCSRRCLDCDNESLAIVICPVSIASLCIFGRNARKKLGDTHTLFETNPESQVEKGKRGFRHQQEIFSTYLSTNGQRQRFKLVELFLRQRRG